MCHEQSVTPNTHHLMMTALIRLFDSYLMQTNLEAPPAYEPPSLAAAKTFYSTTLPRRIKDPSQPTGFRLAKAGELADENGQPSQLYDPVCSKSNAFDEFGVGIALYFKTLKALFWLLMLCAFISLVCTCESRLDPMICIRSRCIAINNSILNQTIYLMTM